MHLSCGLRAGTDFNDGVNWPGGDVRDSPFSGSRRVSRWEKSYPEAALKVKGVESTRLAGDCDA